MIGVRLPRDGAHDAHGDRVAKSFGAAERKYQIALPQRVVVGHRKRRQSGRVDLKESEVNFAGHTHHARLNRASPCLGDRSDRGNVSGRGREHDLDSLRAGDHVRVGDDIAGRIDDHTGGA